MEKIERKAELQYLDGNSNLKTLTIRRINRDANPSAVLHFCKNIITQYFINGSYVGTHIVEEYALD